MRGGEHRSIAAARAPRGRHEDAGHQRGFTIMELLISIAIIFMLMALLIVGVRHAMSFSKSTADRAAVTGLKQGVTQFKSAFGFVPPLVKDNFPPTFGGGTGPLVLMNGVKAPLVYATNDGTVLNQDYPVLSNPNPATTDIRFSVYSLPYYVIGALGKAEAANATDPPVDGQDGPGFRGVRRDGSFERSGRTFGPFYDPRKGDAIYEDAAGGHNGRIILRDSHGVAFRYYRWVSDMDSMQSPMPQGQTPTDANLHIPEFVGDPAKNPDLRNAECAIVGAGPNGVFGDEDLLPQGPPAHPQYMKFDDLAAKVGLSGSSTDPVFVKKVRAAAAADNIVEVVR